MSNQANATEGPVTAAPKDEANRPSFSWLKPHPIFVITLVGPEEQPFGIQKDFLCDRSVFFREYFAGVKDEAVEHVVKLPQASPEVFGLVQQFLYTGKVVAEGNKIPAYEELVGLWRLGHKLGIEGLCDRTLETMSECRRITKRIPSTPLLIQVWKDAPEGSSIRVLLLSWAAEYMRSSEARAEFAKSLPKEVLSELVIAMSSFDSVPVAQAKVDSPPAAPQNGPPAAPNKNVHYLEDQSDEETLGASIKRNRRSGGISGTPGHAADVKLTLNRKVGRPAVLPKVQKRRSSAALIDSRTFTTAQKLDFCADLLTRMLSGPGFWTRLVGPFKEPVIPEEDGVPDYFDKVKKPMDLGTVKAKMDARQYNDEQEFLADIRQIFDNCFTYWKKGDPLYIAGEKLRKTFDEKYSGMNKWIARMGDDEPELA